MKKSKDYEVIKQLYNEYRKHKIERCMTLAGFTQRIKRWFTFWQLCEMTIYDYGTRPRSVSGTYVWKKYDAAIRKRKESLI